MSYVSKVNVPQYLNISSEESGSRSMKYVEYSHYAKIFNYWELINRYSNLQDMITLVNVVLNHGDKNLITGC